MSRTYKYPRESLDDVRVRNEAEANLRIRKRKLKRFFHLKNSSVLEINKELEANLNLFF